MRKLIQIDPWAYYFAAFAVLTVPIDWFLAALCAAVFHELCHIWAIKRLGGKILGIRVCISGTVIETEIPGKREELLSALAGPAGSLLLLTLCHVFPKLAICAWVQGVFNLLPVYPLDGGRVLRCCLKWFCPLKSERILFRTEILLAFIIFLLAVIGSLVFSMGLLPLFAAMLLIIKAVLRKRPCKQDQIRVQ